ncbi:uncharacterized protein LOC102805990, partial [Saccoglossus kowalevskii]|uniref:Aromatic amino acid aminotransferase C569.07-like n=1 Tax=Saccoglossus kowalevskii TaxID=10224 RepID=A0ABM0MSQ4_SACKO
MTMAQKEKQYFRTYFEEISTTMGLVGDVKEGSVAMEIGAPSLTDLKICTDLLSKATQHRLSSETGHLFQYGCTQGDSKFVKEMTKFLTEKYGDEVDSDDILVTGGATSGLYYMTTLLFNRGDIVFVEDPTYFLAINMLRDDLELQVVPVPTTSEGLELEVLDKLLTDYRLKSKHVVTEKQPYWTMLYTVPTFNNPKGKCLPAEKCKKLVEIARRRDIFVVCDDVYNLLSYIPNDKPGENLLPAPMRLFAYDKKQDVDYKGNVVSNCSFSKILGPGMRIGWLEAPQRLLNILRFSGLMCGGGGFNNYTSGIIASVLETGMMSQHILYLQEKYK